MFDIHGVFLYTDFMITLARQIQLKLKKCDEFMIQFKIKLLRKDYPICKELYSDLHKLDEKIQEISKLVDNNKNKWYNIGTQQGVTYVR